LCAIKTTYRPPSLFSYVLLCCPRTSNHRFTDTVDRYIREVLPSKSKHQLKRQTTQLLWWSRQFQGIWLKEVTPNQIGVCRESLLKTRAPATVVRYLAALSHLFTIAVSEWEWIDANPVLKVRRPKEPRGRARFLDQTEIMLLLNACRESEHTFLYPIVVLALSTGMRQGEILNLRWSDVDLRHNKITLYQTKNDEVRVVPLTRQAKLVVEEYAKSRRLDTSLVFPSDRKPSVPVQVRKAWVVALETAKLDDFRFHDLRHTCASYLAMGGATLVEISEVLGHKTLAMVKRYAHLSEPHTAIVVERMNREMFSSLTR